MRTQPWYPSVLQTAAVGDGLHEVLVGLTVGWVGNETLLDRHQEWWVVDRRYLPPDSGLRPERRINPATHPHVHRAARICPLVALTAEQARAVRRVWHGRVVPSERRLVLERGATLLFAGVVDGEDVHGEQLLDRLLRHVSEGELWEDGVLLALELAQASRWPSLERTWSALHGGAGTRVRDARQWAEALAELGEQGGAHELGEVQRQVLPAVQVGDAALPEWSRWVVRASFEPLDWPEAGSERTPRTRSAQQARQLAVGLMGGSALLLAGTLALGVDSAQLTRLLVFFVLVGIFMASRTRVPA